MIELVNSGTTTPQPKLLSPVLSTLSKNSCCSLSVNSEPGSVPYILSHFIVTSCEVVLGTPIVEIKTQ